MKKSLLIYFGIIGFVALYFFVIESVEPTGNLIENQSWYDEELRENGTDIDGLLPSQKRSLVEHDYQFVKKYHEEDYIVPTSYGVSFSRDWGMQRLINEQKESPIEPKAWLFQRENDYFTMLTFDTDYVYNSEKLEIGYVGLDYSLNFDIQVYYQLSYMKGEQEYFLQSGYLQIYDDNSVEIPQCNEVIRGIEMPDLIYTYHIYASPSEDNDLSNDMYYSMNLDVFYTIDQSNTAVQIGFNKFKEPTSYNKFTVIRSSVRYKEEE